MRSSQSSSGGFLGGAANSQGGVERYAKGPRSPDLRDKLSISRGLSAGSERPPRSAPPVDPFFAPLFAPLFAPSLPPSLPCSPWTMPLDKYLANRLDGPLAKSLDNCLAESLANSLERSLASSLNRSLADSQTGSPANPRVQHLYDDLARSPNKPPDSTLSTSGPLYGTLSRSATRARNGKDNSRPK